jgi:hypothetical protein
MQSADATRDPVARAASNVPGRGTMVKGGTTGAEERRRRQLAAAPDERRRRQLAAVTALAGGTKAQGTIRTEVKSAAEPLVAVESPRWMTRTGVKYELVSTASSQYSEGAPAACTFLALQAAHTVLRVLDDDCPRQFERQGFLELYAFGVLDVVLQKAKSYTSDEHQSFADVFSKADSVALRRVDLGGVQASLAELDELCARGDKLRSTHRRSFAAVLTAQSQSICIVWPMGTAEAFVYDSHPRPEPLDPHGPEQNTGQAFRFFDDSRALGAYLHFLFSSADQSKMGVLSEDEQAQFAVLSMADANFLFVGDCDLEPCAASFEVAEFGVCSCGHAKAAHQATHAEARSLLVKSRPNFSRGSANAPAVAEHTSTTMRTVVPSAPRCKSAFRCPDGVDCPRQHSQREIGFFQRHNGRPPPNYKTEQCRFFRDGGRCQYMADNQLCGYAHGEADAICKKCSIQGHWTDSCPAMQIDDAQRDYPSTSRTSAASAAALAADVAALKAELLGTQRERDHALGECARLRDSQGTLANVQLRERSQAAEIDTLSKLVEQYATDASEAKNATLVLKYQLREETARSAALLQALDRSEQRSRDLEGRIVALEMEIAALKKTVAPSPMVAQPVLPVARCCDMEAHHHRPGHSPRSFYEPVDGADAEAQLQRAVELSRAATPRSTGEQAMQLEAARLEALAADRRLAESVHESERQRQQQLELSRQAAELLYEQDRLQVEQERRHQLELSRQAAEQFMKEQREVEASLRAAELLQASFAFTCAICQEEFDISDKLIVDCCNKEMCRECLQRYITGEFESRRFPVRCLFSPDCGGQLSEWTVNLIATDAQLELWREWSRRPTLGARPCPVPDCKGYSLQDDEADVRCQCLLCQHQWCSGEGCEQADLVRSQHAGITCEAYAQWRRDNAEGDTRFGAFVATQLTADGADADRMRKCPQCGIPGMKDENCNHVTCPHCRCHWCFRCAAFHAADANAVYNHQPDCPG